MLNSYALERIIPGNFGGGGGNSHGILSLQKGRNLNFIKCIEPAKKIICYNL